MSMIVYLNQDDSKWLAKLNEYARFNQWSLSKAVRQVLKAFVEVNMGDKVETTKQADGYILIDDEVPIVRSKAIRARIDLAVEEAKRDGVIFDPEPEKIDADTYFAQIESQLKKPETSDIDREMAECVKEKTNANGEVSCYFFDNARDHHSFCKQYCWTSETIWGKRVRL